MLIFILFFDAKISSRSAIIQNADVKFLSLSEKELFKNSYTMHSGYINVKNKWFLVIITFLQEKRDFVGWKWVKYENLSGIQMWIDVENCSILFQSQTTRNINSSNKLKYKYNFASKSFKYIQIRFFVK